MGNIVMLPQNSSWSSSNRQTDHISTEDRARFARYTQARSFYEGEQWFDRRRRNETRLTFNYARTLVRKIASYIFPAPVTFSVPNIVVGSRNFVDSVSAQNQADRLENEAQCAELALAEVIAANDLARLDVALCIESSVLGDAALKVTWDANSNSPMVAAVDPATLTARWRPDNPRQLVQITHRYLLPGGEIRSVLGRDLDTSGLDQWTNYEIVEHWSPTHWQVEIAGQRVRNGENPYGWIPYVIAANDPQPHKFWGESDLIDLYDVCRELNTRMSVLAQVLELSGAPIAVLENVDGSEGISVSAGAKWELPEGAKAYLLDLLSGGGVNLHIDYVNLLYRALHDLAETPRTAFGDSGRTLSGAALEVEIQPLVQKVHRKRRNWDAVFRQRNERLLDLLERFGGYDFAGLRRTETIWPSVLPSDTDSAVRNAVNLVTAGIHSRRTAIAALGGDDPEGEFARVLEETSTFGRQSQALNIIDREKRKDSIAPS